MSPENSEIAPATILSEQVAKVIGTYTCKAMSIEKDDYICSALQEYVDLFTWSLTPATLR